MANKEYLNVGQLKIIDGKPHILPECIDNGLSDGCIYKNEEAYESDWDAICYVPEYGFDDCDKDDDGFYVSPVVYTHNDLLKLCYGNRELCDSLFESLIWAFPETRISEFDDLDIAYYYSFIKNGAKVWWNDPDNGYSSGEYNVYEAPFEFDENGEPTDPSNFDLGAIIVIGNGLSESEVTAYELTPIYND